MKKTLLLTLSPFLFGAVAVQAQTSATATPSATAVKAKAVSDEKTPVKPEELPAAVKQTLTSEAYKGWEVGEAFWITNEQAAYYEINMKQAEKTLLVKIDKEGKKID